MYDFERSLVKEMKNKPFVLIGVNSDDPAQLPDIIKERNLTWDSWADGRGGPIARQWKVRGYPTIVLIDHNGKLRWRGHGSDDLEKTIHKLIREAEQK